MASKVLAGMEFCGFLFTRPVLHAAEPPVEKFCARGSVGICDDCDDA